MSDVVIGRAPPVSPFAGRTVALILVIGIIGFIGTLVLGAYAPDFGKGRPGGGHALSNAAVGYSGIVRLAEATGRNPHINRDDRHYDGENLLVITPEEGATDVSKVLAARNDRPLLVVLPKWETEADGINTDWVRIKDFTSRFQPQGVLAPVYNLAVARTHTNGGPLVTTPGNPASISFAEPRPMQTISTAPHAAAPGGQGQWDGVLEPIVTNMRGRIVVAKVSDRPLYILADPDLIDNAAMKDPAQAASVLALLDWLNGNHAHGIDFDVTLNGIGQSRSPLKLAFEPPFLAATLAIAATLLLAGLHALASFGSPLPRARALAFGKTALVDNSAALVAKAGRQAKMGSRYTEVMRERARRALGVPARIKGEAIDAYLDQIDPAHPFAARVAATVAADDNRSLLAAARALHGWQGKQA